MRLTVNNPKFSISIIFIFLVLSCKPKSNSFTKSYIWENFKIAIKNNDLSYLISNSMDSIKCTDCLSKGEDKLQSSKFIFEKHLEKLYNSELLREIKYSNYKTDSIIRINYNFKKNLGNESSNIIYMFDKNGGKYLFTGMITTP